MRAHLIVQILLEDHIAEMGGAVNYWVDAAGKAYNVGASHVEWAAKRLNLRLSSDSFASDYWTAQGKVYEAMFKQGWMCVAIVYADRQMMIDCRRQTKAQLNWVEAKAVEDGLRVVDDKGNLLADWTAPPQPHED